MVEIEKLALDLSEQERATLAANLLDSLPGILSDEDEGIGEALRRDAEMEADPGQALEDIALARAIEEGEQSELVSRDEVFKALEGNH